MEDLTAAVSARTSSAAAKWRAIDAEQRASGLSVKAFCMTRGVSAASLFAWRRRLRPVEVKQPDATAPVSFVEVTPPPPVGEVRSATATTRPIELELRGRRRVLVLRRGFDAGLLREVLATLEGVS